MRPLTKIVMAADIGGADWYHAGDEAMLCANIDWLRTLRPDVDITVVSRDPNWTARQYGVNAIAPLGFGATQSEQTELWNRVVALAELERDTGTAGASVGPAAHVVHSIACADALIISGGGNLRSKWPDQIYDRMALIQIARTLAKPVIVLGQQIGPDLKPEHRDLLRSSLRQAALVGVRDAESLSLLASIGIEPTETIEQLDDTWFFNPTPSPEVAGEAQKLEGDWIAVTLAPLPGSPSGYLPILESLGRQLSEIARCCNARLVFIPHWNTPPGYESDALLARRLFGFLDQPETVRILQVYSAADVCWLTRQASLIISTRYHPIVFGVSAGVACVAISSNEYTRVKHAGALTHGGVPQAHIYFDDAVAGELFSAALSTWERRGPIRQSLLSRSRHWRELEKKKWACVTSILGWPLDPDRMFSRRRYLEPRQNIHVPSPANPVTSLAARASRRREVKISAVVLTKDGGAHLKDCLLSIVQSGFADELVVCVDQTSKDGSAEVARQFNPNVHEVEAVRNGIIESSLPALASRCSGDFILRVDDDETLGGAWGEPVEGLALSSDVTHFFLPRHWTLPGGDCFLTNESWYPDLQLRLYRNKASLISWPKALHDRPNISGGSRILWDRWINHQNLILKSRREREKRCRGYRVLRPEKHLSHYYLWEERDVHVSAGKSLAEPLGPCSELVFDNSGNAKLYQLSGWCGPEWWGTWTDGERARLRLPLRQKPNGEVRLQLETQAFVGPGHPVLQVSVACGAAMIARWRIDAAEFVQRTVCVPESMIGDDCVLSLSIQIDKPVSPLDLGQSPDSRRIGLGVRRAALQYR